MFTKRALKLLNTSKQTFLKENNLVSSQQLYKRCLTISSEIQNALANGDPIVALESTIVTHGMPYPENFQMATEVENIIRKNNAIPATVAFLNGQPHVGLETDQLLELATSKNTIKVSRRDFPFIMSQKNLSGGTTVSGTMVIANQANISVFVTGGLGGVHRGAEISMDISADLTELGKTPVAVISAGIKSLLDIEKTLEYLETQGVCVVSYGSETTFPSFYSSKSAYKAPYKAENAKEAARIIHAGVDLAKTGSGILFGVPIPEKDSIDNSIMEKEINKALEECKEKGIIGKHVTPYVLEKLNELSKGDSLKANLSLIRNNAKVGAQISSELANIRCSHSSSSLSSKTDEIKDIQNRPFVIGGTNFDCIWKGEKALEFNGSSNCATLRTATGGVGFNLASAFSKLEENPIFLSAVGNDDAGNIVLSENPSLDKSLMIRIGDQSTASYCLVLDLDGEVKLGLGDMKIHDCISPKHIEDAFSKFGNSKPPLVVFDGNISTSAMNYILKTCHDKNIPVLFEPTDVYKSFKPLNSEFNKAVTFSSPNFNELRAMSEFIRYRETKHHEDNEINEKDTQTILKACLEYSMDVLPIIPVLVISLGKNGTLIVKRGSENNDLMPRINEAFNEDNISATHYPLTTVKDKVESVSGAGDCWITAFFTALLKGYNQDQAVNAGNQAASMSLDHANHNVPPELSKEKLLWHLPAKGYKLNVERIEQTTHFTLS